MGCLSYKCWSLVVGWLYMVSVVLCGCVLASADFFIRERTFVDELINKSVFGDLLLIALYIIPGLVVYFISTALLIRGVHKQRRSLILPFICVSVLSVIAALLLMAYFIAANNMRYVEETLVDILPFVGLKLLLIFPVCKFYKQLGKPIVIIESTNNVVPLQTVSLN